MRILTTRFGELDVPDDRIIHLPEGVLGFPNDHRFVLLEHDSEGTPFKWLQSLDSSQLAFIVMDPHAVVEEYRVVLDAESAGHLGAEEIGEEFAMMAIVNIPHDEPIAMTVNVRAPIVVHTEKRIGYQIILSNEDYPIRHRIFPNELVARS
ncbi:flagellar assembly protein FliW [Candidatus Sumerlaeota bacterium]|nr:flagellar assembly protein FliW [Candidatus Sumerlaeota bacterium]